MPCHANKTKQNQNKKYAHVVEARAGLQELQGVNHSLGPPQRVVEGALLLGQRAGGRLRLAVVREVEASLRILLW